MEGLPAPLAVLELLACMCKKECDAECPCIQNKLKCTEMCKLRNCTNIVSDDNDETEEDEVNVIEHSQDVYSDEDDDMDDDSATYWTCPDAEEEVEIETTID